MKNGGKRIFTEGETQYQFNCKAFRECLDHVSKGRGITKGELVEALASTLHVASDTVNKWQYGKYGPADLDAVLKAAEFLHVDWYLLLRKIDGGNDMQQLTERQKDAAKRIYDVLIWFLEEFKNTDGFNAWWYEFKDKGSARPEDDIYDRITRMEERIKMVLNQEYFDLHDHEIYDAFCEFFSETLLEVYNGKVSYAFRFEADGKHSPTLWQDYEKAMQRLNEIVERYI